MFKYIVLVFAGACSFGILSTFVKLAYQEGFTAAEISFSQALVGMVALWLLVFLTRKKKPETLPAFPKRLLSWPLLGTGAAIGLTTFVYYLSVRYVPASLAVVLLMQFTWMGIGLDWLLFGQKPRRLHLLMTGVILTGTVLASGLTTAPSMDISWTGIGLALGSALLYAVYIVANGRVVSPLPLLPRSALTMTGSCLGIFLFNAPELLQSPHLDLALGKWALFLGLFGTVIPPVLFAKGIPKIGISLSAMLLTVELPVAVLCAHILLGERMDGWQGLGVGLMLLAMVGLKIPIRKKTKPVLKTP